MAVKGDVIRLAAKQKQHMDVPAMPATTAYEALKK
jgi:hypothetical protein